VNSLTLFFTEKFIAEEINHYFKKDSAVPHCILLNLKLMIMTTLISQEIMAQRAEELLKAGKTSSEIALQLQEFGLSETEAEHLTKQVCNSHHDKQVKKGLPLLAVGAVLCFMGCAVAMSHMEIGPVFHISLYGMTGLGATSIIAGLMFILG
jgi:hypothetical protein